MRRLLHTALLALLVAGNAAAQDTTRFIRIFTKGEKIMLEVPDTLLGRRVMLSSVLRKSSDASLAEGTDLSHGSAMRLGKTDSLLLLLRPSDALNGLDAIERALPIKKYSADSSRFTVEADKLFDPDWESVIRLKGHKYGEYSIFSASRKDKLTALKGTRSYPGSVGVVRELTYDLKLSSLFGEMNGTYPFTGEIETCLTLLPEHLIKPLKADSRVGTRTVLRREIDSLSGGVRSQAWVARWKLDQGEHIRRYGDTLLAQPWNDAVRDGLLVWNEAFREAGLGDVIEVAPYPAGTFHAGDPLVSTVSLGRGSSLSANLTVDSETGEILACKLSIPTDFVSAVRRKGMVQISDVDPRYRSYDLPADAVAEALQSRTLSTFGLCLGLSRNLAGSYAYSPSQLRDPDFTRSHGITASVTDDVLFNLLARPGDKERGVTLVSNRLGCYDRYAIRWIYDDRLDRKAWLESHHGQDEYLYLAQNNAHTDPRGVANDLGNDPFEFYQTQRTRQQWIASQAVSWIDVPGVSSSFKDLFADYVWLEVFNASRVLSFQLGGLYVQDRREGSQEPKYTAVPETVQRQALLQILRDWDEFSWLDEQRDLLTLAGANRDVSSFSRSNYWSDMRLAQRLPLVAMSEQVAGSGYTIEKALRDMEAELTRNIRRGGTLRPGEEMLLARYAVTLCQASPILTARQKEASGKELTLQTVPEVYAVNIEAPCYQALLRLDKIVKKAVQHYSGTEKGRLAYLQQTIETMYYTLK